MPTPRGEDVATHYRAAHERLAAIAADLDVTHATTPVPSTPGWSVHDVFAHLAALSTEALAGRLRGIPGDEETARQVEQRRDRSLRDVLEEWSANLPAMADAARAGLVPASLTVDAITHEQDVRGALGVPRVPDIEAVRFCNARYTVGATRRISAAGLPALGVDAIDTGDRYGAADHEAGVILRAPAFEVFRALSGRRSRRQAAQYVWTGGEITPYLDVLNVFGDPPRDDVDD